MSDVRSVLRQRIDLVSLARDSYHLDFKRKGRNYWSLCPFHQENSPSFSINPEGFYYCFGCQKGGDLFSFVMEMERISFKEALESLAVKAGISLEDFSSSTVSRQDRERSDLYQVLERFKKTLTYLLENHSEAASARAYLAVRGISKETQRLFSLGYMPRHAFWARDFLVEKGYSESFIEKMGIFSQKQKGYCFLAGRLVFPLEDDRQRCLSWGGRSMGEEGPKYINGSDSLVFRKKESLYGLSFAKQAMSQGRIALVCEGYFDVLAFFEAGLPFAVAPLGTSFTYDQAKSLKRYVDELVLAFDADQAGNNAREKAFALALSLGFTVKLMELPPGEDPSSLLIKRGPSALRIFFEERKDAFEALLLEKMQDQSIALPNLLNVLFEFVRMASQISVQDHYLKRMASVLDLPLESLRRDYKGQGGQSRIHKPFVKVESPSRGTQEGVAQERWLLRALLLRPSYFVYARRYLIGSDFFDARMAHLFSLLEDAQKEKMDKVINRDDILDSLMSDQMDFRDFFEAPESIAQDLHASMIEEAALRIRKTRLVQEERYWQTHLPEYTEEQSLANASALKFLRDLLIDLDNRLAYLGAIEASAR